MRPWSAEPRACVLIAVLCVETWGGLTGHRSAGPRSGHQPSQEPPGHRPSGAPAIRGTGHQGHRPSGAPAIRAPTVTGAPRASAVRGTGRQGHRPSGAPAIRGTGHQSTNRHRSPQGIGRQGHRPSGAPAIRGTGHQGHRPSQELCKDALLLVDIGSRQQGLERCAPQPRHIHKPTKIQTGAGLCLLAPTRSLRAESSPTENERQRAHGKVVPVFVAGPYPQPRAY